METTWRFKVDDSDVEQSMLRQAELVEKTNAEYLQLEKDATEALQAIADNTAKTSKQLDQYADQVEKTAKKTKEAEQETGRFGKGLKTLFGNLSLGGVSINDLSDSLGTLKGGLKDVASSSKGTGDSVGNLSKGFGVLRLGLVGIAVLVAGAVVAAFSKFQKNADSLKVGLAQAKAVLDVSIVAVGKWGNELIKAATGQKSLRDAIQDAKKANADFNIELRTQIALEGKLAKQQTALERTANERKAFFLLQKREIEQLNQVADDTNQPFAKREAASKRRFSLLAEQSKQTEKALIKEIALTARIASSGEQQEKTARTIVELTREGALTTENLANRIAKTRSASAVVTTDDIAAAQKIFELVGALADEQEGLLGIQSEALLQAQGIRDEQEQAAEARRAEIAETTKGIQELLNTTAAARVQLGDENDQIQFAYSEATAEVVRLKDEYTKLSQLLKTGETAEDIERLFAPLQQIADIDFERASFGQSLETVTTGLERLIKIATDPVTGNIADLVSSQTAKPLAERLRADGLEAGKALSAAIVQGQSLEAARQQEKGNEAAKQLISQLAPEAINAFFEAEQARFELRIAQQDAIIAKRQEGLDEARRILEEEQKLEEQGLANGLKDAEKKVKEQERLLRDSENKKLEIERKAASQRKIIAAGQQAVELTLAVAKLISAEASKGLIGLVLAVGGLAIISRLVAAGRSQAAAEAGRTQNFATGTERVRGEGTWTSDSVPVNLSKDERVIKSSDNAKLGFERMSNKQLVHYAILGQRVHSDPLFAFAMGLRGQQSRLEESKLSLQVDVMKDAYKEAALLAAEKQIDYWRTRPIEKRNEAGEKYIEWQEGNRVIRQFEVVE